MLDELEKLAREASGCAFTACGCRDCKAWAYAMNPATGLLLLAAVRAAEARIEYGCSDTCATMMRGDADCSCGHKALDSALAALKEST